MDKGRTHERGSGLIFVACMFIGAGIVMLFDRVEVGGAIGMGVGFFSWLL